MHCCHITLELCVLWKYETCSSNGFLHLLDQVVCFSGKYLRGNLQKCVFFLYVNELLSENREF
jgi:hypothetical protein